MAAIQSLVTQWTELATTTWRNVYEKGAKDNVSNHNALFRYIQKRDNMRKVLDGGLTIVQQLDYQANSTYQRYSGYDVLNINAVDVLTAAEFPWRQVAVNLAASGFEIRSNQGKSAIISLAKAKLKNAQRSMANGLSYDIYSDGSATNQLNGIQALISDTGLGTVGGINAGTFPFWRNKVNAASNPLSGGGAVTLGPSTIEAMMSDLWIECTRGNDSPDIIVASNDLYRFYEQSQTSIKRYTADQQTANGSFLSLKFKNADVFFDSSGGIPNQRMYFINSEFLHFVSHAAADMSIMDEKTSVNQDAVVIPILWQGNMTISARFLQGVLRP